jgi:hypothetical protein
LSSSVPNLSLDDLAIHIQAPGGELNPDGGLGLEAELVASEPGEQVGLAHTRVTDQHHLEEVVIIIFSSVPSHTPPNKTKNNFHFRKKAERKERFYVVFYRSLSLYFLSLKI